MRRVVWLRERNGHPTVIVTFDQWGLVGRQFNDVVRVEFDGPRCPVPIQTDYAVECHMSPLCCGAVGPLLNRFL